MELWISELEQLLLTLTRFSKLKQLQLMTLPRLAAAAELKNSVKKVTEIKR